MFKKIVIFLSAFILLINAWCGTNNQSPSKKNEEKIDFLIQIIEVWKLEKQSIIKKTWKLLGKEDITISSQANWRVNNINFLEWKIVKKDQIVIQLKDIYSQYWLTLDKASSWLKETKISYESAEINLDKAIKDSKLALEQVQINYEKSIKDLELLKKWHNESLKKITSDVSSTNINSNDSQAQINYDNLKKEYDKAVLDYENKLKSDEEQISQYKTNFKNQYESLIIFMDQVILQVDNIVWVTTSRQHLNDSYEIYLWAKNSSTKYLAEKSLKDLIDEKDSIKNLKFNNLTIEDLKSNMDILSKSYDKTKICLDDVDILLKNTISSIDFSETTLNWFISTIDWLKISYQTYSNSFVWYKNWVNIFLNTYQDQQKSLEKQLAISKQSLESSKKTLEKAESDTKINYNATVIDQESQIVQAENAIKQNRLAVENAKTNLENAIKTKDIQLKQLKNWITTAQIWVNEASQEKSKLSVKTPIDGKISKIFVDKWQDIWAWTPLFSVVNNTNQEIKIWFTADELNYIYIWQQVNVNSNWKFYSWTVLSISKIADENINYESKILINEPFTLIWEIATVEIPINIEHPLLSVNAIMPISNSKWYIYIYENWEPQKIEIEIGKTWWDKVEIITLLEDNKSIILSNMKNYDKNKNQIKLK